MPDDFQPKSGPEAAAGGCALVCGWMFVVAGIALTLVLVFTRSYAPDKFLVAMMVAGIPFGLGHTLAITAILSESDAARQTGKRALLVMWSAIAVLFVIWLIFLQPHPTSAK
jgi:cyanate permease